MKEASSSLTQHVSDDLLANAGDTVEVIHGTHQTIDETHVSKVDDTFSWTCDYWPAQV